MAVLLEVDAELEARLNEAAQKHGEGTRASIFTRWQWKNCKRRKQRRRACPAMRSLTPAMRSSVVSLCRT